MVFNLRFVCTYIFRVRTIFEDVPDVFCERGFLSLTTSNAVPPILHRVVRPARDVLRDLRPAISKVFVKGNQQRIFFGFPSTRLDPGSEVLIPSVTNLFRSLWMKLASDRGPLLSVTFHQPARKINL